MKKIIKSKYMPYVLFFLLTIVICAPIFTMNLYLNNEARLHMTRIFSINEVIKDGVFPPIIDYKFMNGFGYALNLFYGPITTYIPIIFLNIFGTAGMALKIFTVLTVILSAITMYHFTYAVTKRKLIAVISTILYISMPYKLSDIYSRIAVGEYTAFIFIPVVFEALYNLVNENKKSYMLALGIIGLVLSHTITTIYIALFSAIYLLLNYKKLKNIKVWKNIFVNILLALLVCSFYVIPLLEHSILGDYTLYNKDLMGTSSEAVYGSGLELKDLFASEFGTQEIRFSIGIVTIILSILTIFCYKKVEQKKIYTDFLILAFLTLAMSTKYFPWLIMPTLFTVIQFTWRNIGFFAFFISLICGINVQVFAEKIIKKELWKNTFIFAVICSVFVFAFLGVQRDYRFDDVSNEQELDKNISESERLYVMKVNRDYMPLKAIYNLDYINKREDRTYILEGNAEIVKEEKDKLQDEIVVRNVQDNTKLELPYLYYLGYEVNVQYDEENIEKIKYDESEKGFIMINLEETNNAKITVEYKGSFIEKVGYVISLLGIVFYIFLIVKNKVSKHYKK